MPSPGEKKLLAAKPGEPALGTKVMPNGKAAAAGMLVTLAVGIGFALTPSEGGVRLDVYLDSAGIPTSCKGIIGPEVTRRWKADGKNARFTREECDRLEADFIVPMVRQMAACVPMKVRAEITYGELKSYGHWGYNTGPANFCSKGSVPALLATGDRIRACRVMAQYVFTSTPGNRPPRGRGHQTAKGVWKQDCRDPANKCSGLAVRRELEVNTCLAGVAGE